MDARRPFLCALLVLGGCLVTATATAAEKPKPNLPWIATGKVTDELGRPIEGAVVSGTAGWGSLSQTGAAETDGEGRYSLRFGRTGYFTSLRPGERPTVELCPAIVHASAPGRTERNLNRQGALEAADGKPSEEDRKQFGKAIILPNEPRTIDFVLVPAATIHVHLQNEVAKTLNASGIALVGSEMPPFCSVVATGTFNPRSYADLYEVPTAWAWRFQIQFTSPKYHTLRSAPFKLPKARVYDVTLRLQDEPLSKRMLVKVDHFVDAVGRDVRAEVIQSDPFCDDPPQDQQARGHDLLRRVGAANHFWLGEPPDKVKTYSYDVHKSGGKSKTYTVDTADEPANANVQHGTSFVSPLSYLTKESAAADVLVRRIEERDGIIRLWYSDINPHARLNASSGVIETPIALSTPIRDGVLEIDAKSWTPRKQELYGPRDTVLYSETFADFTHLSDGSYAPRTVRATVNGWKHAYRFRVYEPGLWLFDDCHDITKAGPPVKSAWIENVIVNAEPAKDSRQK